MSLEDMLTHVSSRDTPSDMSLEDMLTHVSSRDMLTDVAFCYTQ